MKQTPLSNKLASWSIHRPVSVFMLALTVVILGLFALDGLRINLLPHIIYPELRVRIFDNNVNTLIMEDKITRQLEEQLAITENLESIRSSTSAGRTAIDLGFPLGTDIDLALRDASTRLDRAKRFLPATIEPPVIYKRDPMQIPVIEFAVSSEFLNSTKLREWVDYQLRNWLINVSGVASAEVGGGAIREFQVILDPDRLALLNISYTDIIRAINAANQDVSGGKLIEPHRELSIRTHGRIKNIKELENIIISQVRDSQNVIQLVRLKDIARVNSNQVNERLRIRLNRIPAIKLSIQKQPQQNTVEVVQAVKKRLRQLKQEKLIPQGITIRPVDDQSVFIRQAISNATIAVISGAILAMFVVYLFLGNVVSTLIIGSAIPLAIFATFIIMALSGFTLNIMTLGGLALAVGLLIDNTIIMLENIHRKQSENNNKTAAAVTAAAEISSAMIASTSTNLAAILPFLFIGGLIGLLFNELIYTLYAAMITSLLVALTVVPASSRLAAHYADSTNNRLQMAVHSLLDKIRKSYLSFLSRILVKPGPMVIMLGFFLLLSLGVFSTFKNTFLPQVDEGLIRITVRAENGTQFEDLDNTVKKVEDYFLGNPEVARVFTTSGGFVFGRFQRESSRYSSLKVQLTRQAVNHTGSAAFIRKARKDIRKLGLVGVNVWMRNQGIRGIRLGHGSDTLSIRIQGPDIKVLRDLSNQLIQKLKKIPALRNLSQSYDDMNDELVVHIDRERSALLGIDIEQIGKAIELASNGKTISSILLNDREYPLTLRLPASTLQNQHQLEQLPITTKNGTAIQLRDIASISIEKTPSRILRENQQRVSEISASIEKGTSLSDLENVVNAKMQTMKLPENYTIYNSDSFEELHKSEKQVFILVLLALFLVFVVMAIQYESLLNPFIILCGIPFMIIGVTAGLFLFSIPLTMPVWLGIIMLAGIVVNNAIVLVEQIEISRERSTDVKNAVIEAAGLRLRPILMTTLTTVTGMIPLALGLNEGAEMLQPLAIVIVFGLSFSLLVSLLLIPIFYTRLHTFSESSKVI